MVDINNKILSEEILRNKYSKKEIDFTLNYLNSFLEKLNSLIVKENGNERELNELEKIICIYEFVTSKNYKDIGKYSQDIIGSINHGFFVCISFSKMIKVLCDACNIPCFIKYSITSKGGYHANNEVLITDKNGQKHLLHLDATIDCLNYEAVYCSDDHNITRVNALLLQEDDVNQYRNPIKYEGSVNSIYINLVNGVTPDKLFELSPVDEIHMELYGDSYHEIILDKMDLLIEGMKELAEFFHIDYHESSSLEQICESYKNFQNLYAEISLPIDYNEMTQAIENVQMAILKYENPSDKDIEQKAKLITLKKIQKSTEFQLKNFDNNDGKSYMFTFIKNI